MRLIFRIKREKWFFISFFVLESSELIFDEFFVFICGIIITLITSLLDDGLVCFFTNKLLLYRNISSNVNRDTIQNFTFYLVCSINLPFVDSNDSQDSRRWEDTIFIPPYNFHPLTNFHRFICNFASEMTTFNLQL